MSCSHSVVLLNNALKIAVMEMVICLLFNFVLIKKNATSLNLLSRFIRMN